MTTTKPRRARGDDSIYEDKTKGCWVGEIALGCSATGRRLRRKVYGSSKSAVREELRKAHKEIEAGVKTSATYTVGDAVAKWMTSPGVKKLAPKTREKFRTLAEHHLLPYIGKAKLRDLTADDVEEWLEGRATVLTTRTLHELLPILTRSIKLAQRADLIVKNVAELAVIPTGRESRRYRSLTVVQAVALLAAAIEFRLYAYVVVSLMTGIRTEEARELKWDRVHLDPDNGSPPHIEVYRSVRVGNDTKTEKSRRSLELPPEAADALREQKEKQAADRQRVGLLWENTGYVFTSETGTQLDASNVRRQFRKIVVAARIAGHAGATFRELRETAKLRQVDAVRKLLAQHPDSKWSRSKLNGIESGRTQIPEPDFEMLISLYGAAAREDEIREMWKDDGWTPRELRHSFVSLLSAKGVRIEDIARLAGHANTRVTETVYRHQLREVITEGASVMSEILGGTGRGPGAAGSRAS